MTRPPIVGRRRPAIAFAVALLVGGADRPIAAQSSSPEGAPWISLASQPPFILPADQDAASVPLLVTLAQTVEAKNVTVVLLEARYEKLLDERISALFSVDASVDRGAGRGPAIVVKVARVAALRPGVYQLMIGAKQASGGALVQLAVPLERPAVELEPPGKQTLDVFYPMSVKWGGVPRVYPEDLRLLPNAASRFARIGAVTSYVAPFKSGGDRPGGGTLSLTPVLPAAGQPLLVRVAPHGFSAGTWTGSIELGGPDFKAPRAVDVEVRVRHSPGWVVVLIAVGLVFGYLLRVVLQRRVELARARARSVVVLEELGRRLAQAADKVFSAQVKKALVDLQTAFDGRDSAAIDAEVKKANDALTAAAASLTSRIAETHARLKRLQPALAAVAKLPPDVAALLRQAAEVCARTESQLERFDETSARQALDALEAQTKRGMLTAVTRWRTLLPSRFGELERLKAVLLKRPAAELAGAVATLRQQTEAIAAPRELAELAGALDAVGAVQANVAARVEWAAAQMAIDLAEFERVFNDRHGGPDPGLDDVHRLAAALAQQLAAAAELADPAAPVYDQATLTALIAALDRLTGLAHAHATQGAPLESAKQAAFDAARAEGRYLDALLGLPAGVTKLKRTGAEEEAAAATAFTPPSPEARAAGAPHEPPPALSLDEIGAVKARTFGELAAAEGAQTFIAAVLITGLGYVLFADKFVGTLTDAATVFLWGFTLDISVSKLLEVAAPLTGGARKT